MHACAIVGLPTTRAASGRLRTLRTQSVRQRTATSPLPLRWLGTERSSSVAEHSRGGQGARSQRRLLTHSLTEAPLPRRTYTLQALFTCRSGDRVIRIRLFVCRARYFDDVHLKAYQSLSRRSSSYDQPSRVDTLRYIGAAKQSNNNTGDRGSSHSDYYTTCIERALQAPTTGAGRGGRCSHGQGCPVTV